MVSLNETIDIRQLEKILNQVLNSDRFKTHPLVSHILSSCFEASNYQQATQGQGIEKIEITPQKEEDDGMTLDNLSTISPKNHHVRAASSVPQFHVTEKIEPIPQPDFM